MNRFLRLTALAAALSLVVTRGKAADDNETTGIVIDQGGHVLTYPSSMQSSGVVRGEVRVVLSVDAEGKLTDLLVVGYTEREFASMVSSTAKQWNFEPARVHGRPIASRVDLLIEFKVDVNVSVVNMGWHYWEQITGDWSRYQYRACRLSDLDRIPTPVHVVQPILPKDYGDRLEGRTVKVDFFIDEEGRVRVPTVDRSLAGDVYAAAMIAAVEQWRFEPPERHGRPVLVSAQQEYNFRPRR